MVVVGWLGRGSTTLHCTHHALPPHLRHHSFFSFANLFAVRDVLARLLCPSPPGVRSGRAALQGCREASGSPCSQPDWLRHLECERFSAKARAKVLGAGTVITAATGDGTDFVNGLGADVVVDYHEQNIRHPGQ